MSNKYKIMKTRYSFLLLLMFFTSILNAQEVKDSIVLQREARSLLREGTELYQQEKYTDASVLFQKALEKNSSYKKASYNLGNALYQQKNFKEAGPQYEVSAKDSEDKFTKAEAFHNMGNAAMEQKQYQQAVDAYKNALRKNPNDDETRYNLAVAKELLKKKKEKEKKDDKDKKDDKKKDNKDKKENKDKKGDKEKNDDKGDKKKDDKKDDKKNDKKDGDKDNDQKEKKNPNDQKNNPQKPKPKKGNMTPQQIKQLLESLSNEEKKTQKKMNAQKSKGTKVKQEKDW
ncbi:MAG: Ca-activated chloride channel family protein [Polaribacter sp.]|jgi:Ca-activated chloride channel family protein